MEKMRAAVVRSFGAPLEIEERPIPTPGPGVKGFRTHADLAEAIDFAIEGKVRTRVEAQPLEAINGVFQRLEAGKIDGRVVLTF